MKKTRATVYKEKALLVSVSKQNTSSKIYQQKDKILSELKALAQTAGACVIDEVIQRKKHPDPAYYIGRGKAEEIVQLVRELSIDVVIFDNNLTPAQVRNLERIFNTKVIDRAELILDIFATHARTRQAKLQVELAQLEYSLPRLKRLWTHLSRIEGGIGIGQRGPGEKQIEIDRRLAHKRITRLRNELKKLQARRHRETIARRDNFNICLVGYTNTGKSTLINTLTQTGQLVENKLFSTLDTKTRIWKLPDGQKVLLSDTVGFISHLPHHLVSSFHATLEEAKKANLLLHIADASHPEVSEQIEIVHQVLAELDCLSIPRRLIFNKIDQIDNLQRTILSKQFPETIFISALKNIGLNHLEQEVKSLIDANQQELTFLVPLNNGSLIAYFKRHGNLLNESYNDHYMKLRILMGLRDVALVKKQGAIQI